MNYGRFFVLDYETSRLNEGITIFNYRGLEDSGYNRIATPKYPIYLTILKDCIDFRVHYFNDEKHFHNTFLLLPLSANLEVKDGLTSVLSNGYKTVFPVKGERDYLYNLIINDKNIHSTLSISNEINSYSDLSVFEIFTEGNNGLSYDTDKDGNKIITCFIRKIILDFLFDLEHTKVFQNSPYYEYLSIKLRENYFFNALANKAKFYYYRELIKNSDDYSLRFYGEYLFKAEKEWTKSIRNEKSDNSFHESKNWFLSSEKEMRPIYLKKKYTFENKEKDENLYFEKRKKAYEFIDQETRKDIDRTTLLSSKWFIKRCAFGCIFSIECNMVLCLMMLLPIIGIFIDCIFPYFGFSFKILGHLLLLLSVPFYVFHFANKRNFFCSHIYFPRLLIAIITGWITIFFGTSMFSIFEKITCYQPIIAITILTMFIAVYWFTYIEVGRMNPHIENKSRFKRTLYFILISFFYSYMTGFLLSFLATIRHLEWDFNAISCEIKKILILSKGEQLFPDCFAVFFMFTFFAMFIGIFLNMMIQEKRATEPL